MSYKLMYNIKNNSMKYLLKLFFVASILCSLLKAYVSLPVDTKLPPEGLNSFLGRLDFTLILSEIAQINTEIGYYK